jgi:hypothetical protein
MENVDLLKEVQGCCSHALGNLRLRHIPHEDLTFAAFCGNSFLGNLSRFFVEVDGEYLRSFSCVCDGSSAAVADAVRDRAGADHDCDLSFQSYGHGRIRAGFERGFRQMAPMSAAWRYGYAPSHAARGPINSTVMPVLSRVYAQKLPTLGPALTGNGS